MQPPASIRCQMVSAFASASRLVFGHESFRPAEGGSEILASRALLNCLDLEGPLVTSDAMRCQNETAQLIRDWGRYLPRLKANRPALHDVVKVYFVDPETVQCLAKYKTTDGYHGRIETLRAFVSHDVVWLNGRKYACTEPSMLPELACSGMSEATSPCVENDPGGQMPSPDPSSVKCDNPGRLRGTPSLSHDTLLCAVRSSERELHDGYA